MNERTTAGTAAGATAGAERNGEASRGRQPCRRHRVRMELRFVQTNLNYCKLTHNKFKVFTREKGILVTLIRDPYVVSRNG